ncbi:MAG: helix-turn-helix domain-containing protein [Erythrobacter sp.]|uniref:helix-turn-helix domain-containing protein n=1 Tax=Erythrobacter sp. TaxID=1042 RepID=UPI003298F7D4
MIEQWDYLIRLISIGSGLTLIAMVVASEVRLSVRVPLIGMLVGSISYVLNSSLLTPSNSLLEPWLIFVSLSTPFWIWLFGRRLFEREPERRIMLSVITVMVFGWFLRSFVPFAVSGGFIIIQLVSLALVVDLVRVGVFERDDDLVEDRRVVRLWLPLLAALQAGQILSVEMLELISVVDVKRPALSLLNSIVILMLMLFASLSLFRTNRELLPRRDEQQSTAGDDDLIPELDLSPSEKVLHDKLAAAMSEGAYNAPGLTIAALADQLDTPPHRLRALINSRLGHRNFSAFLNRYRIAEAQRMLSSGEHVDLPVLTIAMDLGYNSLPPFNRAFRELTGSSPSEFRKRAFAGNPVQPEIIEADQN